MKNQWISLLALWLSLFLQALSNPAYSAKVTKQIEITVSINGAILKEKITVGLFGEDVPKTVENFREICIGTFHQGNKLSYKGIPFHRIIPNFMIQGGDITDRNGMGGRSIYGHSFPDENFKINFEVGVIAMANAGPNTNGSQFFITTAPTPWLNGHHVVFGRVLKGFEIVKVIESHGSDSGTPDTTVLIHSCKQIDTFSLYSSSSFRAP